MYLKSIDILGFKSFADRTRVELKTGITGVIGPNGCGKSNIMESIRWCIGEMSWKSLRSESMVSVIFAGTARRSPMNLCEVTLTFDNAQSLLPVQYSEVQVTRRLFRSGESEYWLNKTQCRLRDIRELFLDTGIGNDGYAIIDQGQVDFMVKSKPEERRSLFEEAAGVAKYKAKRTEALRKLDRVEIDLGRLQDSVSLINEQIKKLDADARKAELFKKYKSELASLEAGAILKELGGLDGKLAEERARLTPLAESLAELKTKIGGEEARLAALNLERAAQQGQIIEVNQKISDAKVEAAQLEERVKSAERQTEDLQAQLAEGRLRIEEEARRVSAMAPTIAAARAAHAEAAERAARAAEDLERFKADFAASAAERDAASAAVDEARRAVTTAVSAAVEAGRRVLDAEGRIGRRQMELERTRRESEKAGARQAAALAEADKAREALGTAREALAAARTAAEDAEASAVAARAELDALRQRAMELRTEEAGVSARLEALEAQGRQDPYWVGAQAVTAAGIPGIIGTVRSIVDYDPSARREVEDALGERLYAVVCRDRAAARTALELLKGLGRGRARFLVAAGLSSAEPALEGLLARLSFAPENEGAVRHLLGRARAEDGGLSDGPWLFGGAEGAEAPAGGLADVDGLKVRLAALLSDIAAVAERRTALEAERGGRDAAARETAALMRAADLAAHRLEDVLRHAETTATNYQDELAVLASEEERLKADLESFAAEKSAAAEAHAETQGREAASREAETAAVAGLQAAGERFAARRAEKEHLERSVDGLASQAGFAAGQLKELVETLASLESARAERLARHAAWDERLAELAGQRDESLARVEELRASLAVLENEASALHERSQKTVLDAEELARCSNAHKSEADSLQNDIHQGEMALSQAESRRGFLTQRLLEEWQLSYEDAKAKYAEAEVDAERLEFLRRRIAALGNINMAAPEEYEELTKRRDSLQAQVDDLNQAKADLRSVIAKINATTRENFRQTFTEVREHFRKLYAVLFEGGEADLILTDQENLLESGVEIVAQPPGKKLQNLSQLSGGEKTLTAIALLFAFFMVKPSPICMLDEADAALDDANVDRFVSMLREFGGRTQFLIVSHNKKTMEACDAIYGVTMEESGVTQMMSVEFRKAAPMASEAALPRDNARSAGSADGPRPDGPFDREVAPITETGA
ncbi:MAG: AAA family ATPase [Elusimicrobia bacterium]|nr:AAA family ATPase [Elusimicrobiota bacterium]